jgi:hypothetical protein
MLFIQPVVARSFCFLMLVAGASLSQVFAADATAQMPRPGVSNLPHSAVVARSGIELPRLAKQGARRANMGRENASQDARLMADWVLDSGDNRSMPFVIVDKMDAKVFVFDAEGGLMGAAPALLGLARGDHSVPGIGDRKLSTIREDERTTPAGRFIASLDRNLQGGEILWVDYEAAISLHPVITTEPQERRLERLDSLNPLEHRISYGCINVPEKFYERIVSPAFKGTDGIVYVLPEVISIKDAFAAYGGRSTSDKGGRPGKTSLTSNEVMKHTKYGF